MRRGWQHAALVSPHIGRGSPVNLPWIAGASFKTSHEVRRKTFHTAHPSERRHLKAASRRNRPPPKIGPLNQIKVAQDEVLTIKVVDHPRRDEQAEAIEV